MKLAITAETEEDRYDTKLQVKCYKCGIDDVDIKSGRLPGVVEGVLKANTFARQAEVKAWEQEFTACEHILGFEQEPRRQIELEHCSICDLKENLWLCLECGNIGCGRSQYHGGGGNGHGLGHANVTSHVAAVKLGSITPDGTADVYCYRCNEERVDMNLAAHLAHWGINIAEREKTEKSLTEMQIEENLRWEFSMTTEDGKELRPLLGGGFTGLKNLGNSCYLASTLQCLFSLPAFQERYYHPLDTPTALQNPAEDIETQLRKMAEGLLSAQYSKPNADISIRKNSTDVPHQKGLAPAMLKNLIGRGHEEFASMRQQDAFELLLHLLKLITRSPHTPSLQDPVQSFRFVQEERLQCLNCKKVRYHSEEQANMSIPVPVRRIPCEINGTLNAEVPEEEYEPVTLKECFDVFTRPEVVELTCPSCGSKDGFTKRSLFQTLPSTLAINARRFEVINWVPMKLDVPVIVNDEPFDLSPYVSQGLQSGEELLPDNNEPAPQSIFVADEMTLATLQGMGFPRNRCEKALFATANGDADTAMNWLFEHLDDPSIDEPLMIPTKDRNDGGVSAVSHESIESLGAMGISAPQARKALKATGGDVNRALDWVFSHPDSQGDFGDDATEVEIPEKIEREKAGSAELPAFFKLSSIVCHKGKSIHAG